MGYVAPTLSYCVVNTNGRDYLLDCLAAIERTHPAGVEREVLVLDNASEDGSAEAVRALGGEIRLIELERRVGKAENDSTLLREATGRYCLLLNEDSELRPGAAEALIDALDGDSQAAAAGARLFDTSGDTRPLRVALPRRRDGARRGALPAPADHGAKQGEGNPSRRLGAIERPDGAPRGGRRDRLPRPGVLRLLRRV